MRALATHYTARDGHCREVILGVEETGVWLVYDIGRADTGLLVGRLDGAHEKLHQALALQTDYTACQFAFARGERDEFTCPDPLPKPVGVSITQIRARAERAVDLAFTQAKYNDALLSHIKTLAGEHERAARTTAAAA
jgi:hypothetical protein